jgi:hypothetical protein
MLTEWAQIWITDQSGKKFFKSSATVAYAYAEVANLKSKIAQAKANPKAYANLFDPNTAYVASDVELVCLTKLESVEEFSEMNDDELLRALGL